MKKKNLRAMIVVMLMVFAMMPVTAGTVFAEEDSDVTVSIGVYDRTNKVCGQGGSYTLGAEDMTHTIDKHIMTKGASAQLTAAPDDGYEFVGWFMGQIVAGIDELKIRPMPVEVNGRMPVHKISRISPKAAAVAQGVFNRMSVLRRRSEWFL